MSTYDFSYYFALFDMPAGSSLLIIINRDTLRKVDDTMSGVEILFSWSNNATM